MPIPIPAGPRRRRVRTDVRYPYEIPVAVAGLDMVYAGKSVDLSLSGLQIEMPLKQLKTGRFAAITLKLPRRGRAPTEIVLPGDIRWARAVTEAGGMAGIRFVHSDHSQTLLARLLRALDDGFLPRARVPDPSRGRPLQPGPPAQHVCPIVRRDPTPRRDARRRVALPVMISYADGAITGEVCDLSKSGLMLRSPYAVAPGRRVVVRLESPGVPIILPIEAHVRWVRIDEQDAVAGVEFARDPDAQIVRLFFEAVGENSRSPLLGRPPGRRKVQ